MRAEGARDDEIGRSVPGPGSIRSSILGTSWHSLAGAIDWDWIDGEIAPLYSEKGAAPGSRRALRFQRPRRHAANVILTAVGYNFRCIPSWLRALLRKILIAILRAFTTRSSRNPAC